VIALGNGKRALRQTRHFLEIRPQILAGVPFCSVFPPGNAARMISSLKVKAGQDSTSFALF
jgi:hypothetical protein